MKSTSAPPDAGSRRVLRLLKQSSLRVVGFAAILFSVLMSVVADAGPDYSPIVILLALLTAVGLPVTLGLFCLTAADRVGTAAQPTRRYTSLWVWVGLVMCVAPAWFSLKLAWEITATRTQVIVAAVFLMGAAGHHYAQVYRPWCSRAMHQLTESVVGEVLFFALKGFFQLIVQIVVVAMTGGRMSPAFGGGSSGGGGARGRW